MPPRVSVVVSTYERPHRLAKLLRALRAQTLGHDEFEVIVVDNGSGPATAEVLCAEQTGGELPLRTVRHPETLGPAGGRNSGLRLARSELVAFTDDDCVPAAGWLRAGLAAAARHPGAILQGRTEPDPEELGAPRLISRTVSITGASPQYETCNIFYPRALLEQLGGFDESFGLRPAGEDTELAWRAIGAGAEVMFAPDALVHHAVARMGWVGTLRDATRWGACARLFALQPGARAILYRGVFWNVWHYLLVRSLVALLAPPWLRRAILVRHLRALKERGRLAGAGGWAAGYLALYDLLETLSLLCGAIRHRTLVL